MGKARKISEIVIFNIIQKYGNQKMITIANILNFLYKIMSHNLWHIKFDDICLTAEYIFSTK